MKIAAVSDIGKVRGDNQDAYAYCTVREGTAFGIVCDGMGGANGGKFASHTAVDMLCKILKEELSKETSPQRVHDILKDAIRQTNDRIFSLGRNEQEFYGMGTTMVIAVVLQNDLFIANIGDSRAYLYSKGALHQISVDHSAVQELVELGKITREQARVHPQKNLITRAVGVDDFVDFDFYTNTIRKGDSVLLCSDGLSNYCTDEILLDLFEANLPPDELAQNLIEFANREGGRDNITALIIQKKD